MINKFLKGGKQQDAVMLFVKGLADTLQADPNEVILLAQDNPDALESAVLVYQQTKGDMKKAAQAFAQTIQKKTQKALHGAKLQYLKNLKNKCGDDEEIYYYKVGGSLGCGCKKKEIGGEVRKAGLGCSAVDKFKLTRKALSGVKNYTKDQIEGREPVKVVNGVKYYLNGDGEIVKDPKGKNSAKPDNGSWQTYDEKTGKMRPATPAEIAQRKKNNRDGYKGKGEGTPQRKDGGIIKGYDGLRFSFSYQNGTKNGKPVYVTKEFNTKAEAEAYRKKIGKAGKITDNGDTKPTVLKADNSNSKSTAYRRLQEEGQYNSLTFKLAYNKARSQGKEAFGYKGKVYSTDLTNPTNRNMTTMKKLYGNYLGYLNDPKLQNKASRAGREKLNKGMDVEKAPKVTVDNSRKEAMSQVAKNFDAANFVDAIMPTNAIGNFIGMGIDAATGNDYTPNVYVSGFNPFGYTKDLVNGNVGNLALRGLDTYTTLGMPGTSKVIDKVGTRFAPRIASVAERFKYIPKGGTEAVVDEAGNIVGRRLNDWNWWSLTRGPRVKPPKGGFAHTAMGDNTALYGTRSVLRAVNEGTLSELPSAARYANSGIVNNNTGTMYLFRNTDGAGNLVGNAYDFAIDKAMQVAPYWGYGSNLALQQVSSHKNGGSLKRISFYLAGTPKGGLPTAPKAEDRYKNGRKEITIVHPYDPVRDYPFIGTQPIRKVTNGTASISEIIRDAKDGTPADTLYYEIPNHLPFVKVKPRYAESLGNASSKYRINPEFHILKRRFNTAWNLAK